jgi:hypothetical protein
VHRAAILLLTLVSCGKPRIPGVATIEEQDAPLKGAVLARVPEDEPQLVAGFYPAEPDGWRWTRGRFSVVLQAPADAATRGAVLELMLDVPQVVLDQVGPVTIASSIGGVPLAAETRAQHGIVAYRRAVPAAAFSQPEVVVEFQLDKVVQPNTMPGEDRELGAALHGVALLPVSTAGKAAKR